MGSFMDLTGKRFGKLVVVSYEGVKNKKTYWNCICDCGNNACVRADQLRNGSTKSCGCYNIEYHKARYHDLTNQTFGYWKVIKKADKSDNGVFWICICKCGTEKVIKGASLVSGQTLSCGCYNREMSHLKAKHGMSRTRIYNIYLGMKDRCYNPNNYKYHLYGEKGVKVCDEWLGEHGFEHFAEWAFSHGYNKSLTIDRYPNKDGNYEPSNCRWANYIEQANNIRTNRVITYKHETHTLAEWSRIKGINVNTLHYRILKGWDEERLFIPPQNTKGGQNG